MALTTVLNEISTKAYQAQEPDQQTGSPSEGAEDIDADYEVVDDNE